MRNGIFILCIISGILFSCSYFNLKEKKSYKIEYKIGGEEYYIPKNYRIENLPNKKVKYQISVSQSDLDFINNTIINTDFFSIKNPSIKNSIGLVSGEGYFLKINSEKNTNTLFLESLNTEYYSNNENNKRAIKIISVVDSILVKYK
ncbi:hypothetical protein SAMN05443634_108107 [Chishuiella changwenlii]|uniref:Lipoprotein n=1 Tax=Chishuiella changwenlii TaxID=1434701 RepID=A0A1M6ZZH5_9FLAO|nr:hypothetical protein [Chishuiella changwenlii]GGE92088.1 hypothetical protein GCM10010984_07190 [Chishuiella changwenlii]SHL35844.1 hypothetical protein SAMN05443634_108107 [Chishuiella changwenlii]